MFTLDGEITLTVCTQRKGLHSFFAVVLSLLLAFYIIFLNLIHVSMETDTFSYFISLYV